MRHLFFLSITAMIACGGGSNFTDAGSQDATTSDGGESDACTGFSCFDGTTSDAHGCVNLECQQVQCGGNATTSVSGTVVTATPSKYGSPDPIYNAIVYIPNAPI